ncbi:hypothetical protein [Streptomyces clavuligerus]|nr:hypothetical protein [Streptomyces clavuligerus]MBY6303284.1 ABC transporter permease [Streptomyces clavuligerus]QPJ94527.1 ABC transporter permease [Streptomyces clavuligerus]QPL63398.1 ABC transporter permease [Streptomyces clavuligerus]QPL69424.1 ABC transporter permease [Streptomyces clavuligerus]QPL75507.1 ABC transporter permease [Streptomyces clavuligerus]
MYRQLLRVGRAAGSRSEAGGVRFAALVVSVLALALVGVALVATHAAYEGQRERGTARGPVFREDRPELPARALWKAAGDSLTGGGRFTVVLVEPLTADAPLPPGVAAWPARGEAVLSPRLRGAGADDGIGERYGRVAGTIAAEGLQSPDELFAYVRPLSGLTGRNASPIVGFGPAAGPVYFAVGQTDQAKPEGNFLVMPGVLGLLPAGILVVVAARSGAHGRDRRATVVTVLGGTARARAVLLVGETWRPVALGAALALAAVAVSWATDLRLPWTGHVVAAADMRAWAGALLLAVLAAAVAVLGAAVAVDRPGRTRTGTTRPVAARRAPARWAVLCPVLLLVAVRGPDLFEPGTTPYVFVNWIGAAGTLATLPAAVAVLTARLGRGMARLGRRLGSPALLVSGRRAAAHPRPAARLVSGVVVALGLLIQIVVWQAQFGSQARAAQAAVDRIGTAALVVRPGSEVTERQIDGFLAALPDGLDAIATVTDPRRGTLTLKGECTSLTALGLPCSGERTPLTRVPGDPRAQEIITWNGTPGVRLYTQGGASVARSAARDDFAQIVLISPRGAPASVPEVKRLAYRTLPTGADVHTLGGEWLVSSQVNKDHGRWIFLFGFFGILVLTVAMTVSGTAEFLRNGRALAPLTVLSGDRGLQRTTAAWSLLVPLVLAGTAGCAIGLWLALPRTADGGSYVSGDFLAACAAAVAAMGVVAWIWASSVAGRQARRWRPRGE